MKLSVVDKIMATQTCLFLISRTCEYVTLHRKRDFADGIKLKTLRWRNYSGLSRLAQSKHVDIKESWL